MESLETLRVSSGDEIVEEVRVHRSMNVGFPISASGPGVENCQIL